MDSHQLPQKRSASVTSLPSQPPLSKTRGYTDELHEMEDETINAIPTVVGPTIGLLYLIVGISGGKIQCNIPRSLEHQPELKELLKDAWEKKKYRAVREFLCRTSNDQPDEAYATSPQSLPDAAAMTATQKSWQGDYKGRSAQTLHGILKSYMSGDSSKYYARYATLAQSSGTGKSRMNDELAKKILYIPVNLRGTNQGFPPEDTDARIWLTTGTKTRDECERRCQAFLYGALKQTKEHLVLLPAPGDLVNVDARPAHFASMFREKMSDGMSFHGHNEYRRGFYAKVIQDADIFMHASLNFTKKSSSPTIGYIISQEDSSGASEAEPAVTKAAKDLTMFLDPDYMERPRNEKQSPLVVFCFDESDILTRLPTPTNPNSNWTHFSELRRGLRLMINSPIFSLFLSTAGKFHQFTPDPKQEASSRISNLVLEYFPPIVEVGFDTLAKPVSADGTCTIDKLASIDHITHLGRALFGSRYDKGNDVVKKDIISFAQEKLLCGKPTIPLEAAAELACLAVRLSLEFKATAWLDREMERTQVERHMRLCLYASPGFQNMETIGPSEPLLAEAAYKTMKDLELDMARILLDHLKSSYLDTGLRGELVAELLLLLARDQACSQKQGRNEKDGSQRIVTVVEFLAALLPNKSTEWRQQYPFEYHTKDSNIPLEDAFENCHVWFNHFIKVEDHSLINQEYLWRVFTRGAAIVCAINQAGVDILIPFVRGKVFCKNDVSAVLFQIKNNVQFSAKIKSPTFTGMNPFSIGLFSADVKDPPPVIRMVFALASSSHAVVCRSPPLRRSSRRLKGDRFTSYDIWCAGASSKTFGVIAPGREEETFAALLNQSRITRRAYSTHLGFDLEMEKQRVCERRRMAPAMCTEKEHFENYTDLEGIKPALFLDEEVLDDNERPEDNSMDVDSKV